MKHGCQIGGLLLTLWIAGCAGIGPQRLERDSGEYGRSLSDAWESQMLLNIVKLRYADTPSFLTVASVINQYSQGGQVAVNTPAWDRPAIAGPPVGSVAGTWADRPTITYQPLAGDQFTRTLLTPLPPASLAAMMQSGWPADFVLGIAARSVNGISNGTRNALMRDEPDTRFGRMVHAMSAIQRSSQVGLRVRRMESGDAVVLVIRRGEPGEIDEIRRELRAVLGVPQDLSEFQLVYGTLPEEDNQIAVQSRSVLEILGEFSFGVEVPPEHVAEGRVLAAPVFEGSWVPPSIRIHSGPEEPSDAMVAVPYRGLWFWIDDRDLASKRYFTFALLLISLSESGGSRATPLVTVGAG